MFAVIEGRLVQVGDEIEFFGRTYEVERFDTHPGVNIEGVQFPARVAVSGDWAMTVFDDDLVRVHRDKPDPERLAFAAFLDSLLQ